MVNRRGKSGSSDRFLFLGLWNHCGWWLQPWHQKVTASWQKSYARPRQCVEKQRRYSADKDPYNQDYGLPDGHIGLWQLDCKKVKVPIDAFELWCWRRLLKVPWPIRRSNLSILRKTKREYLLEDWCWSWRSSILVIWWEQLTHWKKSPWSWERLRAEEEGIRG